MKPGDCLGTFEENNPLCTGKCVWRLRCEKLTKENLKAAQKEAPEESDKELDKVPEPSPAEHLVALMSGRYKCQTREGDGAKAYYFQKEGKNIALVVFAPSGKVKIQSVRVTRVLDRIESVAQAEELVREMVG
jgi:uncharacterized protein YkuJ